MQALRPQEREKVAKGLQLWQTRYSSLAEESSKTAGEIQKINTFIVDIVDKLAESSFELLNYVKQMLFQIMMFLYIQARNMQAMHIILKIRWRSLVAV